MNITSLIFRRRYPVPVTLDALYRAIVMADMVGILTPEAQRATTAAMKQVTNAIDEIYAVADGREVHRGRCGREPVGDRSAGRLHSTGDAP